MTIQKIDDVRVEDDADTGDKSNGKAKSKTDSKAETKASTAATPAAATATSSDKSEPEGILLEDAVIDASGLPEEERTKRKGSKEALVGSSSGGAAAPIFDDAKAHSGGTYTFNEAGERVPVLEKYVDEDGKTKTRPVA